MSNDATKLKEAIRLLKEAQTFIDKAWQYEGDVFGILHNDVVDWESDVKNLLDESKDG